MATFRALWTWYGVIDLVAVAIVAVGLLLSSWRWWIGQAFVLPLLWAAFNTAVAYVEPPRGAYWPVAPRGIEAWFLLALAVGLQWGIRRAFRHQRAAAA